MTSVQPDIVVSALDAERIEDLLEALPAAERARHEGLLEELVRAELVTPEQMPGDVVTMNSTVCFRIISTGKVFERTLVYPASAAGREDVISILAPVGSALLGLSVGSTITWPKPGGEFIEVEIQSVKYQPERAGDMHR